MDEGVRLERRHWHIEWRKLNADMAARRSLRRKRELILVISVVRAELHDTMCIGASEGSCILLNE